MLTLWTMIWCINLLCKYNILYKDYALTIDISKLFIINYIEVIQHEMYKKNKNDWLSTPIDFVPELLLEIISSFVTGNIKKYI